MTIAESILSVLRHFGWWDLLDVLIVAVLIYEILRMVRGTRAVQMALGAGLIVLVFYLSRWSHLETLNWLIRNMVGYLVFALIVLFQADIRRALAHVGRTPFGGYFARTRRTEETIEEIAVAAGLLSAQRVGGIVAIERSIGLRNYIEGGIPLDATVTYDLLVTIFRPGAPLHDGAVIIQGERIAAAACFLPLTVNPQVSKDFGTRHRAAIGLTEETDAVTVIVSEETGRISLALDGGIESGLTGDDAASAPAGAAGARAAGTGIARAVAPDVPVMVYHPFRHLGLKFLSVGVALGLWFTVAGERTVERMLQVPLELSNPPEQLVLVESPPGSVEVRVRGASGRLSQLLPGEVIAMIDLSPAKEGLRYAQLTPSQVRAPGGVEVVEVKPRNVSLRFEKSVSRSVRVVPPIEGEPAPGFAAGEATVEPATVEVSGPESAMKRLKEATTEPVSVSGQRSQVRQDVSHRPAASAACAFLRPVRPR